MNTFKGNNADTRRTSTDIFRVSPLLNLNILSMLTYFRPGCVSYRNQSFAFLYKKMTYFYMKRNTGLKWIKLLLFLLTLNMFFPLGECRYIYMAEITLVADDSGSLLKISRCLYFISIMRLYVKCREVFSSI